MIKHNYGKALDALPEADLKRLLAKSTLTFTRYEWSLIYKACESMRRTLKEDDNQQNMIRILNKLQSCEISRLLKLRG